MKKNEWMYWAILVLSAFLLGIILVEQWNTDKTPGEIEKETVSKFSYIKDNYGICYATIKSQTYMGRFVVSITTVPCEQVGRAGTP